MIAARRIVPVLLVVSAALSVAFNADSTGAGLEPAVPTRRQPPGAAAPDAEIVTREATCRWADEPPVLDGKLDDRCWQRAAAIDRFGSFWMAVKTPRPGTVAYLVWDDDALYYAGSMTDAELRSFGTKRNDHLWNGDVFELFFKPSVDRPEYYEFQANPARSCSRFHSPSAGTISAASPPCLPWAARPRSSWMGRSTSPAIATAAGPSKAAFPGRPSHPPAAGPRTVTSGGSLSAAMTTVQPGPSRSR